MKRKTNEDGEDLSESRAEKKESSKKDKKAKKEKKSSVQVNSLQSIFASSTKEDATFTLFGDEAPSEPIQPTLSSLPIEVTVTEIPSASERKPQYFFPHFDSPEKNMRSLFSISDEAFFHNRTEWASIPFAC
jgi:hypothetical protein